MAKRDRTPLLADEDILRAAAAIWERRMVRHGVLGDLQSSANYLKAKLAHYDYEVFAVLFLDTHYRILAYEEMFRGTIDGCTVHPREVVRRSIFHNAAAVILAHNHPSGSAKPSSHDRAITLRLREALELIEVRVLDHFVVGTGEPTSLSRLGWL